MPFFTILFCALISTCGLATANGIITDVFGVVDKPISCTLRHLDWGL
jgi:hypothetical protein